MLLMWNKKSSYKHSNDLVLFPYAFRFKGQDTTLKCWDNNRPKLALHSCTKTQSEPILFIVLLPAGNTKYVLIPLPPKSTLWVSCPDLHPWWQLARPRVLQMWALYQQHQHLLRTCQEYKISSLILLSESESRGKAQQSVLKDPSSWFWCSLRLRNYGARLCVALTLIIIYVICI